MRMISFLLFFSNSEIRDTNLTHTNLKGANFKTSKLVNVNLRDAVFNKKQKWIWTGDSFGSDSTWYISFKSGNVGNSHIAVDDYVRPVRSMK